MKLAVIPTAVTSFQPSRHSVRHSSFADIEMRDDEPESSRSSSRPRSSRAFDFPLPADRSHSSEADVAQLQVREVGACSGLDDKEFPHGRTSNWSRDVCRPPVMVFDYLVPCRLSCKSERKTQQDLER